MRPALCSVVIMVCALLAVPGKAQESQDWQWCVNKGDTFSADQQIAGCTAITQSGQETEKDRLAKAYSSRGIAWLDKGDFDRAIADFNDAIRLDPTRAAPYKVAAALGEAKAISAAPPPISTRRSGSIRHSRLPSTTAVSSGAIRAISTAPSPTSTRRSGSTPNTHSPTTTAGSHGAERAISTVPSPTSTRRPGSTRNTRSPTETAAMLDATRVTSTVPSPTTMRRSGLIPNTHTPTTIAATRGTTKAISTAPSPTMMRRSGSIQNTPPSTETGETPGAGRATASAPSPTTTRPSGCRRHSPKMGMSEPSTLPDQLAAEPSRDQNDAISRTICAVCRRIASRGPRHAGPPWRCRETRRTRWPPSR